jgi:hypothetical protein
LQGAQALYAGLDSLELAPQGRSAGLLVPAGEAGAGESYVAPPSVCCRATSTSFHLPTPHHN